MENISVPQLTPDEIKSRFLQLQQDLAVQYKTLFPDPLAPKTVIILPSLTLDPEILLKIKGNIHYEERLLCLLLLLRMPRTQVIYLSSMPIHEEIIDYYLHLLPGITGRHARRRLTLLSCYDASNRPLAEKILERPRMIEKIRNSIPSGSTTHLTGFNITSLEETLAVYLGVPIYGCPSELNFWGTKSGSRELFRRAGLLMPPGYENLGSIEEATAALMELKKNYPGLKRAVLKLNDGFSGDGNAVFTYQDAPGFGLENLREDLQIVAPDMDYDLYARKFYQMGGIVEAFVEGAIKASPSVQCRLNPLQEVQIVSTHDQIMNGDTGQVYQGCTFPASPEYAREVGHLGYQVSEQLASLGVLGRFSIDFISVKHGETWTHYAIEINLRKGGTTHPYLMLQFLTNGKYDFKNGVYQMPNGQSRCYIATDGLENERFKGLTPSDLIDIAICKNIHYDATTQEGVMFHLIGALSEFGKLGVLCVGTTPERAYDFYRRTVQLLDEATC
jgi:hypothetical protein